MSIAAIVAISAVFVTSSAPTNPTLAQINKSEGDNASSSASKDYKDFQKCLSNAELIWRLIQYTKIIYILFCGTTHLRKQI